MTVAVTMTVTVTSDSPQRFLPLANLPTRIERSTPLARRYGITLDLKRDDSTGNLHGGTKLRALEHLLQEACQEEATDLITLGEATSSQCRLVAALGRSHGMAVHLLVRETAGAETTTAAGNLQMMQLLSAQISYLAEPEWQLYPLAVRRLTRRLQQAGRRPYFIPFGCAGSPGTHGILRLVQELFQQHEQSFPYTHVIVPAGSGGTLFGLDLAFQVLPELSEVPAPLMLGFSLSESAGSLQQSIDRYFAQWCRSTGISVSRSVHAQVDDRYANLNPDQRLTGLATVARDLGEIFDSIYVLPALLGMLSMLDSGSIARGASILFLVTGPCLHLPPQVKLTAPATGVSVPKPDQAGLGRKP